MAANLDHSEVINLSIAYLNDVEAIVRCCLASKHQIVACRAHVQQHLPSLLRSAHHKVFRDYREHLHLENVHVTPLEWLYRTAGPAVVALPATASALLCLSDGLSCMPHSLGRQLTSMAVQHGMQLTLEAIVAACKARVDFSVWLPLFLPGCQYNGTAWQLPDHLTVPEVVVAICYDNMEVFRRLLPQVTREQMPDMLRITVNRRLPHTSIVCDLGKIMTLEALLEHDRLHTRLLHAVSSCSSTGGAEVDDSPIALVQQLLISSIVLPDAAIAMLVATPAAQALDAVTVLKLLYLIVQDSQEQLFDPREDAEGSALAALCSLPAVRQLSAAQVGNLMHYAVTTQHLERFTALLALPQAQQLPPKQLFDMLLDAAGHAGAERETCKFALAHTATDDSPYRALICELAELDSAKQLAPGDAFKLLEAALQYPWTPAMSMSEVLQQDLDPMELGSQLTGSELLQLMMMSAEDGSDHCSDLSELMPAASLIDDEASYAAFLEKAMDAHCTGDAIDSSTSNIDLTMRLGPDSVLRLLHKCVSSGFCVCKFILLNPALEQIPTDAVGQLLLQAAKKGMVHQMQEVLQLPAAAELSAALLNELLQIILAQGSGPRNGSTSTDIVVVPRLLKLPAARQLTAKAVTQVFYQVIEWRLTARRHLQPADDATPGVMQELLHLMDAAELPESALVQLLQATMAADDLVSLAWLCRISAFKQFSDAAAQLVYVSLLESGNCDMLQQLQDWVPQIAAAAGSAQRTGVQLQKQIASALALKQLQLAIDLCQHPAAAQISPTDMQHLLQTALQLSMCGTEPDKTDSMQQLDVASVMVSMQAAQALSPAAVTELLGYCLKQQSAAGLQLISKLPATAQLNQQQCESLLQQAQSLLRGLGAGGESDISDDSDNSSESWKAVEGLVRLKVIQTLPVQAIVPLFLSGMKLGVQLPTLKSLVLPTALALSTDDVRMLLLAAVEVQDADTFSWLRSLPAAPDDGEVQAWAAVVGRSGVSMTSWRRC